MADRGGSKLSKSAKRNKRKALQRAAKRAENQPAKAADDGVTPEEIKEILTQRLEEAKENNDHDTMKTVREQLWVINDLIAGVKTDLPDDELKKIMDSLPIAKAAEKKAKPQPNGHAQANGPTKSESENDTTPAEAPVGVSNDIDDTTETSKKDKSAFSDMEKKLRNLKKKLIQTQRIKAKMAEGVPVEPNQVEKVKREGALIDEIEDLELDIQTAKLGLTS